MRGDGHLTRIQRVLVHNLGADVVRLLQSETGLGLAVARPRHQLLITGSGLDPSLLKPLLQGIFLFLELLDVIGLLAEDLCVDAALDLVLLILLL